MDKAFLDNKRLDKMFWTTRLFEQDCMDEIVRTRFLDDIVLIAFSQQDFFDEIYMPIFRGHDFVDNIFRTKCLGQHF